ncbi:MAG: extracellular solute-binding protein [Phormidesmis sp.]
MINRRKLLIGTALIALSNAIAACSPAAKAALKITVLEGSIPSEVLKRFRQQLTDSVDFKAASQLSALYQQLQRWAKEEPDPKLSNLVSLGDYWLTNAIAQQLIEPIQIPASTLEKLPTSWVQFVSRDRTGQLASDGALWAAPYKVQSLVIVYRHSQFDSSDMPPFTSWNDLLRPDLRQQIALPDHPRLVLGLLQKMRNGSFNPAFEKIDPAPDEQLDPGDTPPSVDEDQVKALSRELAEPFAELNAQVKTYDSDNPLKALVNEDVKAVVSWSGDAIATLKRYRDFRVAIPAEGSLFSADMWVRPQGADMSVAAKQWIDFCWQPGPATQISVSGEGISPVFLEASANLPAAIADSLLASVGFQKSEPLLPLPAALQATYLALWQQLRTS